MRLGDGFNNDCDEFVDEEVCDGIDNDNDGLVDEDCSSKSLILSSSCLFLLFMLHIITSCVGS